MNKHIFGDLHQDAAGSARRRVSVILLVSIIFAVFLSLSAQAAEENLEKLLSSREKGWATGTWRFTIRFQKQTLGKMEMEIRDAKNGYEADMTTTFEFNNMKYEITGRSIMDENLGLLWSERVEKGPSKNGDIAIRITAEIKDKILTITVNEDGKQAEKTEMEAPSPLYAGTPALFAMMKLLNLRRPQRHTFSLYNAENRKVVVTNLDVLGNGKLIEIGGNKMEAYSVVADNGKNKMLFEVGPGNEVARLSVPGEPLSFERIFQKPE